MSCSNCGSIHVSNLKWLCLWQLCPKVFTDLHLIMTVWYFVMGMSRSDSQFVWVISGRSFGTSRNSSGLYASLIDSSKHSVLIDRLSNESERDASGSSDGDHSSTLLSSSSSKFSYFKRAYSSSASSKVGVLGLESSQDSKSLDWCRSWRRALSTSWIVSQCVVSSGWSVFDGVLKMSLYLQLMDLVCFAL